MAKRYISIVVPFYNEATNIKPLYDALIEHVDKIVDRLEIIFVDDGSRDNSVAQVRKLQKKDKRVRLLRFSRNFGKEAATSAGLHAAKGNAAIVMDADLQHPPHLIPQFLDKWEQGQEVVVGVKHYSKQAGWFKRKSSGAFYKLLSSISHTHITPHATDFRLIDRVVLDEFNRFTERNRMIRGLIDWLGFDRDYIYFTAAERHSGKASYNYRKLVGLAFNSLTSYSLFPLRLAGYIGVFILAFSGPMGVVLGVNRFLLDDILGLSTSGTALLAVMLLFLVGMVLASLGLVALYIAHIHAEVIDRPLYILRPEEDNPEEATV